MGLTHAPRSTDIHQTIPGPPPKKRRGPLFKGHNGSPTSFNDPRERDSLTNPGSLSHVMENLLPAPGIPRSWDVAIGTISTAQLDEAEIGLGGLRLVKDRTAVVLCLCACPSEVIGSGGSQLQISGVSEQSATTDYHTYTDSTGMNILMPLRKNQVLKTCRDFFGVAACF